MHNRLFGRRLGGFAAARLATIIMAIGSAVAVQTSGPSAQELPRPGGRRPWPAVVHQPPMDTSTKPWTGKRLPDGQPDVTGGVWEIINGGTGRLDNPWNSSCFDAPDPTRNCPVYDKPRPTRIIDPPTGRVPYQPWALARQEQQEIDFLDPTKPEHIDPQARCLPSSVPRMNYYISDYKISQSPGIIAFTWEGYHAFRIIPLNNKPHLGSTAKTWMGDARGRWDGNTLLVETTNLNGKMRLTSRGDFFSPNASLKERFVFFDSDNMVYEVTITDPTVYTRPWTMRVLHKRNPKLTGVDAEFWEEACWEGNQERPGNIDSRLEGASQ